jgi:predicted nucleic acid-binding protein
VRRTQVLAVSPGVVVEALQRARDPRTIQLVLAKLWKEPSTFEDALRAAELMRAAGRASGEPHRTVHEIGVVDGLVAAMAERLSGIVYTRDPRHLDLLRDAGAAITVAPVPF